MLRFLRTNNERSKKYKNNAILIIILQGINTIANFLLVSATLNYLGVEEYGVWITLTSTITWFNFLDIGLAHGLRNKYAEAKADNDHEKVKGLVSTAFFSLLTISSVAFLILISIGLFMDWSVILNAPSELRDQLKTIGLVMISTFCIKLIINIVTVLKTADQHPALSNFLITSGNVLALFAIYCLVGLDLFSFLNLGLVIVIAQILPLTIAFIYLFSSTYQPIFPKWKYFSVQHIKSIFNIGFKFFGIQLTGLFILQSNVLIIAHVCGQEKVTDFNIAFKYLWIIIILFTAIMTPMWSATTEAYMKNDISWLKNSMKNVKKAWVLLVLMGVIMVLLSPFVYKIWLDGKIDVDFKLIILMLLYFVFTMRHSMYRTFMNGVSKVKLQFFVSLIQALLHIPLAILSAKFFGVYGVLLVMILWVMLNSVWEPIQYNKIIEKKAKGIWYQ